MKNKRVALITGGSRGIGRACALRLAQDGINIIINYNQSEKKALETVEEIKSFGSDVIALQADVSNSSQVQTLFRDCITHYGQLDILVNNAGIVEDSFVMMMGDSSIDNIMNVNVKSCFYCCKQAALKMFRQKHGKIINISSVSAIKSLPGQSLYSATKGAINSMTRVLALELSNYGIQVNSIAPGFVETDMIADLSQEKKSQYLNLIPLKRFAKVEEIAETVSFLCSEKVNYITGQVIVMDGGLSL